MSTQENTDIHRITLDGREFVLVGTAHISQDSVDTVKAVIQNENPDTVCVELDEQRHRALRNPRHWESLNLVQVLRQGQAPFLLANLALVYEMLHDYKTALQLYERAIELGADLDCGRRA